jgi:hypothetical protein
MGVFDLCFESVGFFKSEFGYESLSGFFSIVEKLGFIFSFTHGLNLN